MIEGFTDCFFVFGAFTRKSLGSSKASTNSHPFNELRLLQEQASEITAGGLSHFSHRNVAQSRNFFRHMFHKSRLVGFTPVRRRRQVWRIGFYQDLF